MLTWARYLLIVSLTAVLVTGPVLAVPSLKPSCAHQTSDDTAVTESCPVDQPACCSACSGGEKSCCQKSHGPAVDDRDAGCGSCPLGQCGCCQVAQGLTVVGVLPNRSQSEPRVLVVRLVTTDSVLTSRSDEPLLPPPIA